MFTLILISVAMVSVAVILLGSVEEAKAYQTAPCPSYNDVVQQALADANNLAAQNGFGSGHSSAYFFALASSGGSRGHMIGNSFKMEMDMLLTERARSCAAAGY